MMKPTKICSILQWCPHLWVRVSAVVSKLFSLILKCCLYLWDQFFSIVHICILQFCSVVHISEPNLWCSQFFWVWFYSDVHISESGSALLSIFLSLILQYWAYFLANSELLSEFPNLTCGDIDFSEYNSAVLSIFSVSNPAVLSILLSQILQCCPYFLRVLQFCPYFCVQFSSIAHISASDSAVLFIFLSPML